MNFESSININGLTIPYSVSYGKAKRTRMEYRAGILSLLVPKGFTGIEELLNRHRLWIYRRHVDSIAILHEASSKEFVSRSDDEFQEIVMLHVKTISNELGVMPEKVTYRKMKTKWGSCSSNKRLNFNRYLTYLPECLIEFVVFHEMAHLIELRHSTRFWSIIDKRFSDRKYYDRQLSVYWQLIQKEFYATA